MLSGAAERLFQSGRGTQVVRERSAKPLCVGSIPTRASSIFSNLKSAHLRTNRTVFIFLRGFPGYSLIGFKPPAPQVGSVDWMQGIPVEMKCVDYVTFSTEIRHNLLCWCSASGIGSVVNIKRKMMQEEGQTKWTQK